MLILKKPSSRRRLAAMIAGGNADKMVLSFKCLLKEQR